MRRKIKELMNKEEGFTLVELLAVIVILGIIVAIAIPAIGSVIDRAGKDSDKAEDALVVDAARLYVTTNREKLEAGSFGPGAWTDEDVTTETLYNGGFLEDRGGKVLTGSVKVTRTETETGTGIYKYTYDAKNVKKATP